MMNFKNPEMGTTLTFDQFRAIVDGSQPIPDNIAPEVLDLILDCIEVAGSDEKQPGWQLQV
jgi:hypothetical protein